MLKNKKTLIALSIIPQIILYKLLSLFPEFVETYYSNGFYVFVSKILRFVFGWLPFSFGDVLYTLLIFMGLRWFVLNLRRLKNDIKNWIIDSIAVLSIIYFTFHIFWGLNYYREPVHKVLKIQNDYDTETLITVTKFLIYKANSLQVNITKNDSVKVIMPYAIDDMKEMTTKGYNKLATSYPALQPFPVSVKSSIYSLPLTYMGFSGYLNPFTNEAQVNYLIPYYQMPTTLSHEQAHQIGYAAENEANFIACLATIYHDDIYFKYSGYVFALKHCLNDLHIRDKQTFEKLINTVNIGILKNFEESSKFWSTYENPLNPLFHNFYSGFLKANNQDKGIESYSYVVALLVNYFKHETV